MSWRVVFDKCGTPDERKFCFLNCLSLICAGFVVLAQENKAKAILLENSLKFPLRSLGTPHFGNRFISSVLSEKRKRGTKLSIRPL